MNHSKSKIIILVLFLSGAVLTSCKKSTPAPSSSTPAVKPSTFTGNVNGSPPITFTPSKTTSGSNVSLVGKSSSYTITFTFPSSIGPGFNNIGQNGITASIATSTDTYIVNSTTGTGTLQFDSIPNGKYYGHFNFIAQDASANQEDASGQFANM